MSDAILQQRNFEQLANATQYYQWMTGTFLPYIDKRILEIGCGEGNITVNVLDKEFVLGIDFEEDYLKNIRERFKANPNFSAESRDITKSEDIEALKKNNIDTIICINVIEHIDNEVDAAKNMYEILQPGGHIIMLAPAFNSLMSPYDKMVGHYRRYTKKTLRKTLQSAGFEIKKVYYFNMLGALAWLLIYKMLKRKEPGTGNVSLLEGLVPLLKFVEHIIPAPFGLSVIAIAKKPTAL